MPKSPLKKKIIFNQKETVLVWAAVKNYHRPVTCKQQALISDKSWGPEVPDQGTDGFSACGSPLLDPQMAVFSQCPHMGKGIGSSLDLFSKAINRIRKGSTLMTQSPP